MDEYSGGHWGGVPCARFVVNLVSFYVDKGLAGIQHVVYSFGQAVNNQTPAQALMILPDVISTWGSYVEPQSQRELTTGHLKRRKKQVFWMNLSSLLEIRIYFAGLTVFR